jgi:hypothetical protein
MSRFSINGPTPLIDGKRAFRGRRQLSGVDCRTLGLARRFGIRMSFERGETLFWAGDVKLRRYTVLRLLQLRYLIAAEDGLFPGTGQTLLANTTPPPPPTGGAVL